MTLGKSVFWLLLFILIGGVSWLAYQFWRTNQLDNHFEKIAVNDSEEKVIQLMGKPTTVVHAGEKDPYWFKDVKCSKQYQYFSTMPYVNPEILTIGFDENGKVVGTYPFRSP